MMTVAELIELLKQAPQDAPVAYCKYSEQMLMEKDDIKIVEACEPRGDGWIQNARPDMAAKTYILFPGN